MSPCANSRPKMMGLGQELNPSPIILPADGRMALRHFAATKSPLPPLSLSLSPENSQSRRWAPLWGSGDFAEFPGVEGRGGRGARHSWPLEQQGGHGNSKQLILFLWTLHQSSTLKVASSIQAKGLCLQKRYQISVRNAITMKRNVIRPDTLFLPARAKT